MYAGNVWHGQFQSTLPRGERLSFKTYPIIFFVSIHAPARGATIQHTGITFSLEFQSTLPRGERRNVQVYYIDTEIRFNPRSRAGSDPPCRCLSYV